METPRKGIKEGRGAVMSAETAEEITDIVERIRDLHMSIVKELGDKGNSVSGAISRCAGRFWERRERGAVIEYQRKKRTTEQEVELMEDMYTWDMQDPSGGHKKELGEKNCLEFDAICALVRGFLARNESKKHETTRLEAQTRTLTAQEIEAAAEATRRAEAEARQALRNQTTLENARDLVAKASWSAAREKLAVDVRGMEKTYNKLVSRVGDAVNFAHWNSPGYLHVGDILGGLAGLSARMWLGFRRTSDTHKCCEFLRDCTKYLACDGRYTSEGWRSTDDRFTGVYKGNYKFRRSWVAFLSQIVRYVEMINEDEEDTKLYLNQEKLASMSLGGSKWTSRPGVPAYAWSTVKQDIATAQAAIDQEPERSWLRWRGNKGVQAKLDALKELVDADEGPEAGEAGDRGR